MTAAGPDVLESPERRHVGRRAKALMAGVAALLAVAWGAVALRPEQVEQPALPGWPAAGARAADNDLRERAWRAWARHDVSVALDRTAVLFADDWPAARRVVVVLGTPGELGARAATVLVAGDHADRVSTRRLNEGTRYFTEVLEADGQRAVLAVAPGLASVVVTTARVGDRLTHEAETTAAGGVLLPEAAGRYATRIVLEDRAGGVIADRIPGAELRRTPTVPLILREWVRGGRRVHLRTDGADVRCEVVFPDPAEDDAPPLLVDCPPTSEDEG